VAEEAGFSGYLTKPMRHDVMKECLAIVFGRGSQEEASPGSIVTCHVVCEVTNIKKRVLLAEDNTVNQMVAVALLKKMGLSVDVVADGSEAVKALEQIPYDLVFMDCQMPIMDGYEATRVIRDPNSKALNHAIPIIAMTANAMQGDREKCLEAGMNDYTSKPVKLEELQKVIGRLLHPRPVVVVNSNEKVDPIYTAGESYCRTELLERFEGDQTFVNEVIAMSRDDFPVRLDNLRRFLNQQQFAAARLEAHTIKGIAANICAEPLKSVALLLEKELGGSEPFQANRLFPELETRISELVAELKRS
jgi:CheY-like chemotaxis protein